MIRSILAALVLTTGFAASAATFEEFVTELSQNLAIQQAPTLAMAGGFKFKAGDTAAYNMLGGLSFIPLTMTMTVKSAKVDEVVFTQEMGISLGGAPGAAPGGQNPMSQSCDTTINPLNGQIKSIVCNGQSQPPPAMDPEVLVSKEDHVTVPAGSFDCIYMKVRNKKDNSISEQWINPQLVPLMGLVKATQSIPLFGYDIPVVLELTSSKRN
jgi:hypothetical protein